MAGMTADARAGETQKRPLLSKIPDWMVLLSFTALFLTLTVLGVREKSATWDETAHLPAGYLHLRFADYDFNREHPPLVKMLAALPLLFVDVKVPHRESPLDTDKEFEFGHRFLYEVNDGDQLLFLGRLAVLPLALLLGSVVFLWAKQLFGREAALFALLLYSLEPNILAHSALVTTDLGAACFMFVAVYCFYRLVQEVSLTHLAFAGIALGLALVTKFSTITLIPILVVLAAAVGISPGPIDLRLAGVRRRHVSGQAGKLLILLGAMVGMWLLAYGTIWASYRFGYEGPLVSEQRSIEREHLGTGETTLVPGAYLDGLSHVFKSSKRYAFLMGELSTDGWWHYFIVTFLLKTPLPLLLLLAFTPLTLHRLWREKPVAVLCLLVPVLLFFGVASASKLNIGHRHILPVYPFLIVMASSLLPWALRRGNLVKGVLSVLAVWYVISSLSIFPHYLAYFNELAGGPANGYKYLVDSNLDWGQDLKGLKRYMDEHRIRRVWLSYFGTASPDYYGIAYNYLPSYLIFHPNAKKEPTPYIAISATNLQGVYLPVLGLSPDYFGEFRRRQPTAKIGYSIFLYRME